MDPFSFMDGYKSYLTGAGLLGLALYQLSQGDYVTAYQSALAGLALISVRHAVAKVDAKVDASVPPHDPFAAGR